MLTISLPLPPSINHCYATLRSGRRVLKRPGLDFLAEAERATLAAAEAQRWQPVYGACYAVALTLHPPTRGRFDGDNRVKLALDGISRALGFDDSLFTTTLIVRGCVGRGLGCIVRLGRAEETVGLIAEALGTVAPLQQLLEAA